MNLGVGGGGVFGGTHPGGYGIGSDSLLSVATRSIVIIGSDNFVAAFFFGTFEGRGGTAGRRGFGGVQF